MQLRDPADRIDLGDRAVERRAGAQPAGAHLPTIAPPRTFGGDANGHAGRPRQPHLSATTLRRPAPRRLAGIARCSKAASRSAGVRSACSASSPSRCRVRSATRPRSEAANLQSFMTPPGRNAGGAGDAFRPQAHRGRDTVGQWRHGLATACACSRNWCPACWSSISASRRIC